MGGPVLDPDQKEPNTTLFQGTLYVAFPNPVRGQGEWFREVWQGVW